MTLLYLDTSALFKRYVEEDESEMVLVRIADAPVVGTALIHAHRGSGCVGEGGAGRSHGARGSTRCRKGLSR